MASKFSLSFARLPSIVPSYARIVLVRKAAVLPDGVELPRLEARAHALQAEHASAWRRIAPCAAASPSDVLPMAYPHVLATPVQLALLSSSAFPVRIMGLVHLRNHIEQQRPLRVDESRLASACGSTAVAIRIGARNSTCNTQRRDGRPPGVAGDLRVHGAPADARYVEALQRPHQRRRGHSRARRRSRAAREPRDRARTSTRRGRRHRLALRARRG